MTRARTAAFLLAAVALALVAAGCGDDDDSGDSGDGSATALTKEEFLQQGNAICANGNAELDAVTANFGPGTSPAEIEAFVTDTLVPNVQGQIDDLSALTPPEGDEEEVEAILTAAEDALAEVEEVPSTVTEDGGTDPFNEANRLAEDYGLVACGSG